MEPQKIKPFVLPGAMVMDKKNLGDLRNELVDMMRQLQVGGRFDYAVILSMTAMVLTELIEHLDE